MSEKVVNFSDLGRKGIKALIYTEHGKVITEYNQNKIEELKKEIENPILIFNPDVEAQVKMKKIISNIISKNISNKDNDNLSDINISAQDLIVKFLPLCTNIYLDLDEEKDKELIKGIIDDPSDEFSAIISEVSTIVARISNEYVEFIESYSKLPKEKREELLKEVTPQLNEKEKKKLAIQKQQEELNKKLQELELEDNK